MNSESLSAFAETLRDNDEQFYNTFPEAKLAALYAPHTLYADYSFVYSPQQTIDGAYVQVNNQGFLPPSECPSDEATQLHYDYAPVQPEQTHLAYEEHQTSSFVATAYDYSTQPNTVYATHAAQEPADSVSPPAVQYASSPSSFYTPADTPPEVAVHDDPHAMPIQLPVTAPSNAYVGPVRSHSAANPYPTTDYDPQSLARPSRPSRPRHHDNAPYPAPTYSYQQIPSLPPRHSRSLSQGGMSAPQRLPVRALSASASSPVWIEGPVGVGSVGNGPSHHGSANVDVMIESPLSRSSIHSMRLSPLPSSKRPLEKKPPLACLFCRGRKIACGPPLPGSLDKTCKCVISSYVNYHSYYTLSPSFSTDAFFS